MLEVLLLHVRLGDGLTSFNWDNRANFSGETSASKLSGVSIFLVYEGKSKISSSFSSTNLKVPNDNEELKNTFYGMESYLSEEMVFCGLFF